jgi:hypothetical protein
MQEGQGSPFQKVKDFVAFFPKFPHIPFCFCCVRSDGRYNLAAEMFSFDGTRPTCSLTIKGEVVDKKSANLSDQRHLFFGQLFHKFPVVFI